MWSDTSHGQTFSHGQGFAHAPALDRLCLHSRLGCVLAGSLRSGAGHNQQQNAANSLPSASEVSAEAAIFVAVIVVFYAAIIVILLGTNMRSPKSSSSRPRRSRSRSRPRHQLVLDPRDGSVSTQHTQKKKKKRDSNVPQVGGADNV
ncbi:uncharacterized protein LOC121866101 [Homarus americanus]|uniref:uncharacterized protein LOC121866101 n=1 Tax=Homarus americanus TaxID=6706 RepID=UPI001C43A016|nr:uncharacterized protein LOC121866101 [Homarus americanus]XP_042221631.1 uncharacterized protein LOC121866101 [Homarus americanus]